MVFLMFFYLNLFGFSGQLTPFRACAWITEIFKWMKFDLQGFKNYTIDYIFV